MRLDTEKGQRNVKGRVAYDDILRVAECEAADVLRMAMACGAAWAKLA